MKLNRNNMKDVPDSAIPLIEPGVYFAYFRGGEVKPTKDGSGQMLNLRLAIANDPLIIHETGKEHPNPKARFPLLDGVYLTPKGEWDPDVKLKEISVAMGNAPEDDLMLEQFQPEAGPVWVKVKVEIDQERTDENTGKTYPARNTIRRYTKITDDDQFNAPEVDFS
jgi:hypothetical protein